MSDYIKREDAVETARLHRVNGYHLTINIADEIEKLPSADVAPVRHGRWVVIDAGALRCSFCGVSFPDLHPLYEKARYCPCCGSKMNGGDEDE